MAEQQQRRRQREAAAVSADESDAEASSTSPSPSAAYARTACLLLLSAEPVHAPSTPLMLGASSESGGVGGTGLRRLVPVHDGLVRAASLFAVAPSTSTTVSPEPEPEDGFDRLLLEQEEELVDTGCCSSSILWKKRLLLFQYRLFLRRQTLRGGETSNDNGGSSSRSSSGRRILEDLRLVAVPTLLRRPNGRASHRYNETGLPAGGEADDDDVRQNAYSDNTDGDEEEDDSMALEFAEAVLDAVFATTSTSLRDGSDLRSDLDEQVVGECVSDCQRQFLAGAEALEAGEDGGKNNNNICFKMSCRLLVRLYEWVAAGATSATVDAATTALQNAVADQIVEGINHAITGGGSTAAAIPPQRWLQPIYDDLLPLLLAPGSAATDDSRLRCLETIWLCVWERYDAMISNEKGTRRRNAVLIVLTTVLCSMLPTQLEQNHEWPIFATSLGASPSDFARCKALHNPQLWALINRCLSKGLTVQKKVTGVTRVLNENRSGADTSEDSAPDDDAGTCQLLRRRGLYLLGILVQEPSSRDDIEEQKQLLRLWSKYIACCETVEMEVTPHLIDQIWETVGVICSEIRDDDGQNSNIGEATPPPMSWKWIKVLLARAVTASDAPGLRKLCLYRLFSGQAGIIVKDGSNKGEKVVFDASVASRKKTKTQNPPLRASLGLRGAPLSIVSTDFMLEAVFPSFDTLESSVGSRMHLEEDRKELQEDMYLFFSQFLDAYVATLLAKEKKCAEFFSGLWSADVVCRLSRKTTVFIFSNIAKSLERQRLERGQFHIPISQGSLGALSHSFHSLLALGSVVASYRETLLESLAVMLSCSKPIGKVSPKVILDTLLLFPTPERGQMTSNDNRDWLIRNPTFLALRQFVQAVGGEDPSWASTVGSTIATAFVDGMISGSVGPFDPLAGTSASDIDYGKAVVIFCALVTRSDGETHSAGEFLWPAIRKGISNAPASMVTKTAWPKADRVSRALVLLEYGCKLHLISGMGNGDLVVDRKTQQMMPPPPNIEALLGNGVNFILHHINFLLSSSNGDEVQAIDVKVILSTLSYSIGQLKTIHEGFPPSISVSGAVDQTLVASLKRLSSVSSAESVESVQCMVVVYAALSSGSEIEPQNLLSNVRTLLDLRFSDSRESFSSDSRLARSLFEYSKWGSLCLLLPTLFDQPSNEVKKIDTLVKDLFEIASKSVPSAPSEAFMPLFECVLIAAKRRFWKAADSEATFSDEGVYHLEKVIRALTDLMDESGSRDSGHMLDELCALIFQPDLMLDEARRVQKTPGTVTPVLNTFRRLIEIAGRLRPHITEAVLCRAVCGWLGPRDARGSSVAGVAAIPYRNDIASLLVHKEERQEVASLHQDFGRKSRTGNAVTLPKGTDETSIARGYILIFLSNLPNIDDGLPHVVLSELLNVLILRLLDDVRPLSKGVVMLGSLDFCKKMRGWQALCILSRFVTADIVETVQDKVFEAMGEMIHGQIRYFIEVFAVQCTRKHPVVFGKGLIQQITRTDLHLQNVCSLMICLGSLIVGRYSDDWFRQYDEQSRDVASLNQVLSGVVPWLGSTQGFSRAIAQLLAYKLIPMVIDINQHQTEPGTEDSDWYLRSIYCYLEKNIEMKRLRKKQAKFFERNDVDEVCTPEGVLGFPVDEGGESLPLTLVDVIKDTLKEAFLESHGKDRPVWKQVEDMASESQPSSGEADTDEVNFQRKIIPVDALNLALEDMQERRLRNRAGRTKQKLIVCATFIDKVPNLGGLARTSEIFAAEKLVVPDVKLTNMDNFKNLSLGADDWIDIEECKEEVRIRSS